MRKVAAEELYNLDALRRVYTNPDRSTSRDDAVLRVFHVQNAPWAVRFLLRKFNIHENRDDLVGTDFGRYVKNKRPERRGRNPFLGGRTWKVQHDPWRGVSTTSFGLDYLKEYRVCDPEEPPKSDDSEKLMELNCFDENGSLAVLLCNMQIHPCSLRFSFSDFCRQPCLRLRRLRPARQLLHPAQAGRPRGPRRRGHQEPLRERRERRCNTPRQAP